MPERKAAILNVSKALLGVSLTALAAIGSASGITWIAGVTALPAASLATPGTLKPLLQKKKEVYLELPIPHWWTGSATAWQATCSSVEMSLPTIMDEVAARLKNEREIPTRAVVQQVFADQIAHHLPEWEVSAQDSTLTAISITPPLLEKSAEVLKEVIQPIREDALADMLEKIAALLEEVKKGKVSITATLSPGLTTTESTGTQRVNGATQHLQANAIKLQEKVQNGEYDVYICYAQDDEAEVYKVGERLKNQGILPWFDFMASPGELAMKQQEQQIEKIQATAVFVGQYAIAGSQEQQMYAFIRQYADRGIPVIPVLLESTPQKPKLPPFLANFQWVDFHRSIPEPMGQLIWGITGKRSLPQSERTS